MTSVIDVQMPTIEQFAEMYYPKLLHKKCRGKIKADTTMFSVRYRCDNPVCPHFGRLFPLEELLAVFVTPKGEMSQ